MSIVASVMVPHPPIIIPAVGRGEERKIQKTINAYETAAQFIADSHPDTIVITSPHSIMYSDYFHISPGKRASGSLSRFGADKIKISVDYDTDFVEKLCGLCDQQKMDAGTLGERDSSLDHATIVPLYFISTVFEGKIPFKVVRIGLSGQNLAQHYLLGKLIKEAADASLKKVAIIASGDLSHKLTDDGPYGYAPEGPEYDKNIMNVMERGAFGELFEFDDSFCDRAGECGHRSFVIMAGAFDGCSVSVNKLSYEGPFGVGYGICTFTPGKEDQSRHFYNNYHKKLLEKLTTRREAEDEYVRLARRALEAYVLHNEIISVPDSVPSELKSKRAGTFVSLHIAGQLRGCIGTTEPTCENIAEEIIQNAISACSRDPRFPPVTPPELDELEYSVDVLSETEKIKSPDELNIKRYGVIVSNGGRRGLLLPNLDGVDTIDEQISIAKSKAGIGAREQVTLERFEVVRHF